VNGQDVTPENTPSRIVANIRPGTSVPLSYLRDGRRRQINVTVGRRPSDEELAQQQLFQQNEGDDAQAQADEAPKGTGLMQELLGIEALEIDARIAGQLGVARDTRGLAIVNVDPSSDAARRGLSRGVMILAANSTPIGTIEELEAVLEEVRAEGRQAVLLRVQARGGPTQSIPVRFLSR
jgi:serine protease Do